MWNEVYLEKNLQGSVRAESILQKLNKSPILIDQFDDIWGRSKKPYLHKRDSLNLFIAEKKGQLIKEAPAAYGKSGEAHYYFIHAYNCIYECEYCYLQGYFNSPDIVLFINHEEIILEMEKALLKHPGERVWFHAGEFSDSLALTHLTGELDLYHDFCQRNPRAYIELRTKSVNTRELLKLQALNNLVVSFSLSPEKIAKSIDQKTPGTQSRLKAMKALKDAGFKLGAHFDPIVYEDHFKEAYQALCTQMKDLNLWSDLEYLSLGVVRFTKDVYREMENNYPNSLIHTGPMVKSFDGKVRYHRPLRMWMMNSIKDIALNSGCASEAIYLCMEEDETGI